MERLFSPSLDLLRAQQFTAVDSKCSRFLTIIRPLRASKPTDESHKYHGLPSLFSKKPLPLFSWKCTIQQQNNPKPHLGDMCTVGPICFGLFSGILFEREGRRWRWKDSCTMVLLGIWWEVEKFFGSHALFVIIAHHVYSNWRQWVSLSVEQTVRIKRRGEEY